jgi:hypothetical protein
MTVVEMNGADGAESADLLLKFELTVKTGHDEERVVEIEDGQPVGSILAAIAAERGGGIEEFLIFREGELDPIPGGTIVGRDYPHRHRHHVHHHRDVEVITHYQADSHRHKFKRSQTVEAILDWAIPAFGIDPTMAPEFELARHGSKEELPLSEHLGYLAGRRDCLELDLIRSEMPNG